VHRCTRVYKGDLHVGGTSTLALCVSRPVEEGEGEGEGGRWTPASFVPCAVRCVAYESGNTKPVVSPLANQLAVGS